LDEDPVLTFHDAVLDAAATDPELIGGLRAISSHFERHVLSRDLPDNGPEIGGIPRRATPLVAAGYLVAKNALKRGRRVGDLREAIAKTRRAIEQVEPDFAVELAKAIQRRQSENARFRAQLDEAAQAIRTDLGTKSGNGSPTTVAMISGGGGGEGFCTICANGDCYPGTEAECLILIVIVIIIVVTK
jgi:hypothetical protein